ncbi:hypothetical protein, variant [Verruconis gallopava]|uniref:Serine-rich protein n=1 Tax=Verruconis gallopava TaxID=253628 RepID=A0A0D1YGJ9_9PEZI|nr:hypothetical protein, variant [Verruconis gallopava]KIV99921.1 hypothetical protein, variant [Verruconis gallopava]
MSDCSPDRLSRIPTLTPSSPKRRPLAQRSDSESNSASASTIRLVFDERSNVYSKSPFPTHPSHVLPPRVSKLHPLRYAPFVDKDVLVSDDNGPANRSTTKLVKHDAPETKPQQPRWPNRTSISTNLSDPDTSTLTATTLTTNDTLLTTPSSSRQSSRTTPPSSPGEPSFCEERESRLEPVHEETVLESPRTKPVNRPTIRAVAPSGSDERLPLRAKRSETSLASASSVDTLPALPHHLQHSSSPSSANFEVFAHSSSDISLPAGRSKPLEPSPAPSIHSKPIHDNASLESLVLNDSHASSNADRPASASSPSGPGSRASASSLVQTAVAIQYPVVKPPSTSGSWAEVSSPSPSTTTATTPAPRMRDDPYRPLQWGSRLSTIASESERSHSHSISTDSARRTRRRRTIGSLTSGEHVSSLSDARSSEWEYGSGVLTGTESNISIPIPQPLFSPRPLPSVPDERVTARDSDEREDTVGELQSPYLRPQRSGVLTRFSSKSSLRPSSSDSTKSRSSQISFIGELLWARRYYSSGEPPNMIARNNSFISETSSTPRLNTATSGVTSSPISDTVPTSIWRPRNRPRNSPDQQERRLRQETRRIHRPQHTQHSVAITEETDLSDEQVRRRRRSLSAPDLTVHEMMYSPHLRRDRRQTQRYSAWAAPSFDEPFGKTMFGPINRQVFCFALGFIFPPAWWVAALLPLPNRPDPENIPNMTELSERIPPSTANMSEVSLEEKRWQKAHWWRRVNRVLGLFGILLVAAIIVLALIGTKKDGFSSGIGSSPITVPTSGSS